MRFDYVWFKEDIKLNIQGWTERIKLWWIMEECSFVTRLPCSEKRYCGIGVNIGLDCLV